MNQITSQSQRNIFHRRLSARAAQREIGAIILVLDHKFNIHVFLKRNIPSGKATEGSRLLNTIIIILLIKSNNNI